MGQKVVLARTDRALVHSFSDKRVGRVDVQARMLLSSDEVCSEKPPHMRRLAKFAAEDAIDIAAPAVDLLNIGALTGRISRESLRPNGAGVGRPGTNGLLLRCRG